MSAIPDSIDPVAFLQELGLQVQDVRGDEVWARCPGHLKKVGRIDHDASWSVNTETGEHHCFSCGYGGTIWGLIAYNFEWYDKDGTVDTRKAEKWLSKRAGTSLDLAGKLRSTAETFVKPTKRKTMDEARLALFVDPPDYALHGRALTPDAAEFYGIRWDSEYEAWVLPIRDPDSHKLWGWQLKGEGIFRNRPPGVRKSETLFGWERAGAGTAILVESPLDCARLRSVGITNAHSSYGAIVSDRQLQLLASRYEHLIVALDNDAAGRKGALKLMGLDHAGKKLRDAKSWNSQFTTMKFFTYTSEDKDPGDMTSEQIWYGYEHAMSSIHSARAVLRG